MSKSDFPNADSTTVANNKTITTSARSATDAGSASDANRTTASRWRNAWARDSWVRPFLKQYRTALAASIVLGILTMVFAVGLMFTAGFLISDAAEQPELGLFSLLIPLGLVQVFGIGKPFLGYYERLTSHDWVLHTVSAMRVRLFDTIESQGMFWNSTRRAGEILGLLADDIDHVQNLYLRVVFPYVIAWVLWAGIVICFGAFSPLFGVTMLFSIAILTLLVPLVSALSNGKRALQAKYIAGDLYALSMDNIIGIDDWRFSLRKNDFLQSVTSLSDALDTCQSLIAADSRRRALAIQITFGIISVVILVWAATTFGSPDQPIAGSGIAGRPADWIAAFVIGFFPLLEAFSPLPDAATDANMHLDSIERLNHLVPIAQAASASSATTDIHPTSATSATPAVPNTPSAPGTSAHCSHADFSSFDITLDNVCFSYDENLSSSQPKNANTLRDISISIPHGTKLAILGPSGSGKTTLLSLIRGDRIPTQGHIHLGGIETAALGDEICDYIGFIQQDTYLFNQTVFENLAMNSTNVTRAQATEAIAAVGLQDWFALLPQGLDTLIDEAGTSLSGGERQRIALARVLLKNTPIVIMDEPTVSLDPLTERNLLDTVFALLADRTIIMVTHHLLGIEHMDRVIFMNHGEITMDGAPAYLSQTNMHFQSLLEFDLGSC